MRIYSIAPLVAFALTSAIFMCALGMLGLPTVIVAIVTLGAMAVTAQQLGWRAIAWSSIGVAGFFMLMAAFFLAMGYPVFAQAAGTATNTVDLNPLANAVTTTIVDVVTALIGILGLWLSMELKKKWGIDIEAQVRAIETVHRDTLHSAVDTWTKAAIAKFGPSLTFSVGSPEVAYVLNGVAKSAPDAIAALKPGEQWVINKAAGIAGVTPIITP